MKKGNIIKNGAIIMAIAIGGTGLGISIHEGNLDHLEKPEDCLYCKLDPEHMAYAINRDHSDEYVAVYQEGQEAHTETKTIMANQIILEDGSVVYTAPAGYTLDGNLAHQTTHYPATIDRTEVYDKETHELVRIIK